MGEILLKGYLCERCEHKWFPRDYNSEKRPFVCPRCKSPYWDVPRKDSIKRPNSPRISNGIKKWRKEVKNG